MFGLLESLIICIGVISICGTCILTCFSLHQNYIDSKNYIDS